MTTALDRRMKRAAKAQGRGGRSGPKVGVIAPTLPPETKPRKRETKDPDDETLDAALETKDVLPKASGDGTEGIWRKPKAGDRVRLTCDIVLPSTVDGLGNRLFSGSEWRVYRATADGSGIQLMDLGGRIVGNALAGEFELIDAAAEACDDPTHNALVREGILPASSLTKSKVKRDRRAVRREAEAAARLNGPFPPGFPKGITLTCNVACPGGGYLMAKNQYVVYRENLDGSVDVQTDGGHGTVRVPKEAYRASVRAEASAAAPQLEPPVDGTGTGKKGRGERGEGRAKPAEASAELETIASIAGLEVVRLPLKSLVRHPQNRRPLPADVAARADSLEADGQLEPIVVRPDGESLDDNGRFQILSGETRYLAAQKLGWPDIAARVVPDCDDRRALRLLALFNAQRKDLNPIEKARALEDLAAAGYTRDQAAKFVGLETGAAATNLVRLLELPEFWQARVASGELPQSWARPITTLVPAPRLMAELEKDWTQCHRKNSHDDSWESRPGVEQTVHSILNRFTRPVDAKTKRQYSGHQVAKGEAGWSLGYGDFPRLFELTDDVRKKLGVVTLSISGEPREVATNVAEFEKLQHPLVAAALRKKSKGKAAKTGTKAEAAAKPKDRSPAEKRAAKKKADEQLAARIDGWRSRWLKSLIAAKLLPGRPEQTRAAAAIMLGGYHNHHQRLCGCLERTVENLGIGGRTHGLEHAWAALAKAEEKNIEPIKFAASPLDKIICQALKLLLAEEDRDPRRPLLSFQFIDAIAAEMGIDLAEAWQTLGTDEAGQQFFEEFLLLHTGEQLDELAGEWSAYDTVYWKPKAGKIEAIFESGKTRKLPKSIKPLGATGKRKRGRK